MTGHHRNVDNENRPAIATGPSMPDKPPRYRSSPPTPSDFVGTLPPPLYATYWGYLSQADTHLRVRDFKVMIREFAFFVTVNLA
jgi:hypothetical protein